MLSEEKTTKEVFQQFLIGWIGAVMVAPNRTMVRFVGVISSRTTFLLKVVIDCKFYLREHDHNMKTAGS